LLKFYNLLLITVKLKHSKLICTFGCPIGRNTKLKRFIDVQVGKKLVEQTLHPYFNRQENSNILKKTEEQNLMTEKLTLTTPCPQKSKPKFF